MKKTKRLLILLLCLLLMASVCFTGCSSQQEIVEDVLAPYSSLAELFFPEQRDYEPQNATQDSGMLFWEVSANGGTLYLLGSIHVGDASLYPLDDSVMQAFESADALAVEFDIVEFQENPTNLQEIMQTMMYTDGSTIQDHIDQELYDEAKAILQENGLYTSMLDYYKPVMWQSFLSSVEQANMSLSADYGVDMYFLEQAHDVGKDIWEIESAEEQFAMEASFSDELQEYLLYSSVSSFGMMEASTQMLYEIYKTGDPETVNQYLNASDGQFLSEEEQKLVDEYNEKLLYNRNRNMADKAEDYLATGKTCFYVVGAAHMVGEDGIVSLLEERGYEVTKR